MDRTDPLGTGQFTVVIIRLIDNYFDRAGLDRFSFFVPDSSCDQLSISPHFISALEVPRLRVE